MVDSELGTGATTRAERLRAPAVAATAAMTRPRNARITDHVDATICEHLYEKHLIFMTGHARTNQEPAMSRTTP